MCPNDTIFDQQNFICASWWDTDCKKSETFYSKNDLYKVNDPWAPSSEAPRPVAQQNPETDYYEYFLDYEEAKKPAPTQEYDYQYYETTGKFAGRRSRSREPPYNYYDNPPLARSVSESANVKNSFSPSKGYVISTKVGPESTHRPLEIVTASSTTSSTGSENLENIHTFKRATVSKPSSTTLSTTQFFSTTEKSQLHLPFEANFDVGKPVVSVSSTSSRLEVSSPRYEQSTPQYGFFSVQHPSTTPSYEQVISTTLSTTTSTTTSTSRPIVSITTFPSTTTENQNVYKDVKEFNAEDLDSYSDSEDPFANIDWEKDSLDETATTSTTTTRHENSYEPFVEERRTPSVIFPIGRRRTSTPEEDIVRKPSHDEIKSPPTEAQKSVSVTSSSSSSTGPSAYLTATRGERKPRTRLFGNGSITGRRRQPSKDPDENAEPQRFYTGPSRQDFSNFRYFKTAFGNSESSATKRSNRSRQSSRSTKLTEQEAPTSQKVFRRPLDSLFSRRSLVGREATDEVTRTASRNTRYSIYA